MPAHEKEKIMHIALPVGSNMCIPIDAASEEEATRLFNGLSAGSQVSVSLQKMFWGAYFGMFTYKFGLHWIINHDDSQRSSRI